VEGSFEDGNEPSGSIKYWEIVELLVYWRLLKEYSTPWSWLFVCVGGCFAKYRSPTQGVLPNVYKDSVTRTTEVLEPHWSVVSHKKMVKG
jgi:hypothetical protein